MARLFPLLCCNGDVWLPLPFVGVMLLLSGLMVFEPLSLYPSMGPWEMGRTSAQSVTLFMGGESTLLRCAIIVWEEGNSTAERPNGRARLCIEGEINVCTWLREISSCSFLTVLPGPAWVLLSKTNKPLFTPLYL